MGSPEGPWVFAMPDQFVIGLNDLAEDAIPEAADRWARSEELSYHSVAGSDLVEPLTMIRVLANKALSTEQKLFLRMAM